MKKSIISFAIVFVCLLSVVSVSAGYTTVKDEQGFMLTSSNYGTAKLSGQRDDSSDRLSNVTTSKTQKGSVTVSFASVTRPSQYSAKVTAHFNVNGVRRSSVYLAI